MNINTLLRKTLPALLIACCTLLPLHADMDDIVALDTHFIDTPSANVLDQYGFQVQSRYYSEGGVLMGFNFGIFPRLNLGIAFQVEHFIGSSSDMKVVEPALLAKFRIYDGSEHLPSFAIGYDGQGYYYSTDKKKYLEKKRGLYGAFTKEVFFSGFNFNGGLNISDFDNAKVYFFTGLSYNIDNIVNLMLEWDNIHDLKWSRLNAGIRAYLTNFLHLDIAIREIGANDTFSGTSTRRKPERIISIQYQTSF